MDYLILEKQLQVLKTELLQTKPNDKGEFKEYCKLSLFDRDNSILINVNCYDFSRYSMFVINEVYDFRIRVTVQNDKFNFWLL